MTSAYRDVFRQWGAPLETMAVEFVDGKMFRRLVPIVGANRSAPPPPKPLVWVAARLHPEFRRREKAAARALRDRPDQVAIDGWATNERNSWITRNRALQALDPSVLDDAALAGHVDALEAHLVAGWLRHHTLHGSDLGSIGDLLAHGVRWGLDPVAVMGLLRGASPATCEGRSFGRRIAAALRTDGIDPETISDLDIVRGAPTAAPILEEYLDLFGWRVVTSYDLEGLTTGELPSATSALIRASAAGAEDHDATTEDPSALRAIVPAADRVLFDDLLGKARRAYGVRDDNGPLTAEWPIGLMRRAYLEAGRRLVEAQRLTAPEHVFELDSPEVAAVLRSAGAAPSAEEASQRAANRTAQAQLVPPAYLGPPLPDPDPSPLPPSMRRVMEIILAAVSNLEVDQAAGGADLTGLGIGRHSHRAVARVAVDPDAVLQTMQPGDVLVATWTAPSYNAVLAIAGAVVVQEGGLLCHAAVMARELGIPAVIGCRGAMTLICDGDVVEVDPAAGEVRIIERAGSPS